MTDKEVLDMIEDLLVNNFGVDDNINGAEAVELLERIASLVESRSERRGKP